MKSHSNHKKIPLTLLLLAFLVLAPAAMAAEATIQTDKTDYEPGDTVIYKGSGFTAAEVVNLEAKGDTNGTVLTTTATADASGAISGTLSLTMMYEAHYAVTATGASSGLVATTSFKDTVNLVIDNPSSPNPQNIGSTVMYTVNAGGARGIKVDWTASGGTVTKVGSGNIPNNGTTASADFVLTASTGSVTATGPDNYVTWTITGVKATPVFSGLSAPTISYGDTPTTLSGTITSAATLTGSVSITLKDVIQTAAIGDKGAFSSDFATGGLTVSGSPYTITYSYAGDTLNNPVTDTSKSLTINKATPVITWPNPANIDYGTALSGTQLNASTTVAGTLVYNPPAGTVLTPSPNNYNLNVNFTPTDIDNYNNASASVKINVIKVSLMITANSTSKTYGQTVTFAGTEFTTIGLISPDTVTSVTLTSAGAVDTAPVGTYAIVPSAAVGTGLANYNISYVNGTLTVNPHPNMAPTANADGPYSVLEGGSVVLNGAASSDPDQGDSIVLFEWDFNYDGSFNVDATGVSPTFSAAGIDGPSSRTVALRVTDNHGATSSISTSTVSILEPADATPPETTITLDPGTPNGKNGWYITNVHVTVSATDNLSGVAETRSVLDPVSAPASFDDLPAANPYGGSGADVATDGEHIIYAASKDNAGNKETPKSASFKIDKTPPETTCSLDPLPNANGWNKTNVTVTLRATDNEGGSGVHGIGGILDKINLEAVSGDERTIVIETEGIHTLVYWAFDNAGNREAENTQEIMIDWKPPTITADGGTYTAGTWTNQDVTVHFTCSDPGGSGVASCPADVTVSAEGVTPSVSGTATDNAGNSASASFGPIQIDTTPPVVTGTASPAPNAAGWNNTDVLITWTASDPESGIASGPMPESQTVSSEGEGQVFTSTATNGAGLVGTGSVTLNIDKTAPSISGAATTSPNANGWYKDDVTVHFTASDDRSGIDTVTPDTTLTTEGAGQSVVGTATDKAGNSASATVSGINIDKTAPTITGSRSPAANSYGWNNVDVTVSFTATDDLSEIDTVSGPTTLSGEGAGQSVTGTATDKAGNSASATVSGINIDKTAPKITGSRSPAANSYGWNNVDVTVSFETSDSISGVDPLTDPPDVILSGEGAGQSCSGTVYDKAGNSASATVSDINIDKTAPSISGAPTTSSNANGWWKTDVTVHFTSSDGLSGLASVTPDTTLTTEGAGQSVVGTATDKAGNSASATVSGINIDKTPPTFGACPVGGPFLKGSGLQPVGPITVDASISGLDAAASTLIGSVDTSSVGTKDVTFTATDKAGNVATKTCSYNVIPSATINVIAASHSVGTGSKPATTKAVLALDLKVFDKAAFASMDPKNYPSIYDTTGENLAGLSPPRALISLPALITHGGGPANLYTILVPANTPNAFGTSGSYLVIGKGRFGDTDIYPGSPTDLLAPNSVTQKYLQAIMNGAGKVAPAKITIVAGTLLLIAEPEYLEFTSETELLPIIYESVDGDWNAVVKAEAPEGFVSNPGAVSVDVGTTQLQAAQFTVKDVGSSWTSTRVTHRIRHQGRERTITSDIGMVNRRNKNK